MGSVLPPGARPQQIGVRGHGSAFDGLQTGCKICFWFMDILYD